MKSTTHSTTPYFGTILIVDDTPINVSLLFELLKKRGYEVLIAQNGERAFKVLEEKMPDLILLDVRMPGMNGFEVCEKLKSERNTRDIPVIFMTALNEPEDKVQGFAVGGIDYITKPIFHDEVLARIHTHLTIRKQTQELQKMSTAVEQSSSSIVITDLQGNIEYCNPHFTKITQYSLEEVYGKNPRILKSGKMDESKYKELWKTIAKGENWFGEFLNKKKNGDLYWELASISGVRDNDDKITHYVKVGEDITHQKKIEETLRERNIQIENDLELAEDIHRSLLPKSAPQSDFITIDFIYEPLELIGGDFFSFYDTMDYLNDSEKNSASQKSIGIFIGDVQGHGVTAALYTALVKYIADQSVRTSQFQPDKILKDLNEQLTQSMPNSYLTAIYSHFIKLDPENEARVKLLFAKGGHPFPILYSKRNNQIQTIQSKGTLLGMFEKTVYPSTELMLFSGDRIFFYTDGFIEQDNEKNEIIPMDFLEESIQQSTHLSLKESLQYVLDRIYNYRGTMPIKDDLLIIGAEIT